ncbi:MAG TPA: hypothetical protein VGW40_09640 [Allosphingosinicella sp.]|nr:hypothetical protein [Allosphingosinicella sp.]
MIGRAAFAAALLALIAGCGGEDPQPGDRRKAVPRAANLVAPEINETAADAPISDDALASMSPRQRRAYDRGLADCRAGRYRPADHPEAYRIGCAAAHDR